MTILALTNAGVASNRKSDWLRTSQFGASRDPDPVSDEIVLRCAATVDKTIRVVIL